MTVKLNRNAYSPRLLAEDLQCIVKADYIRKQIAKGKLKARRIGGRTLIITREDAEQWLSELPSASEPTNLGGSTGKRARSGGKARAKTAKDIASDYQRGRRMASARRRNANSGNDRDK